MSPTPEEIIAYVDGEMDETARAEIETRAAADPELAAQIAAHQSLTARLQDAFGPVADEPVPDALKALLAEPAPVEPAEIIAFPPAKPRPGRPFPYQIAAQITGMAACFVAGVGLTIMASTNRGDFKTEAGVLIAQGSLNTALTRQLASDTAGPKLPAIGLTFADQTGAICRTFTTSANEGLACQHDGDWRIEALTGKATEGEFRQAASPLILQAVETRLSGDIYDAAAEKSARDRNWTVIQ